MINLWQGKANLTDINQSLCCDVNADGRINTQNALEISEFYVSGTDFGVIEKIELLTNPDSKKESNSVKKFDHSVISVEPPEKLSIDDIETYSVDVTVS